MVNAEDVKDYIRNRNAFRKNKGYDTKQYEEFKQDINELKFDESHILSLHLTRFKEDRNIANRIKSILENRGFSEEYINAYLTTLKGKLGQQMSDSEVLKQLELILYDDSKLKISTLKNKLNIDKIEISESIYNQKDIFNDIIENIKNNRPDLDSGLTSILTKLNLTEEDRIGIPFNEGDIVGLYNPKLNRDRRALYNYYKEHYKLFDILKEDIKDVLKNWEAVEEDVTRNVSAFEEISEGKYKLNQRFTDMDKELEKLLNLYEKIDGMNWIVPVSNINVKTFDTKNKAYDTFVNAMQDVFGAIEDDVLQIYDDDSMYYERAESQTDEFLQRVNSEDLKKIESLDPLYVLANKGNVISNRQSRETWNELAQEFNRLKERLSRIDSTDLNILEEIIEEHGEIREQVSDFRRTKYYIPLTERTSNLINETQRTKVDFGAVENFHFELIDVIDNILEGDTKTSLGIKTDPSQTAGGADATQLTDKQKPFATQYTALSIGTKGERREIGQFIESFTKLFETAEKYYLEPMSKGVMTFRKKPRFLTEEKLKVFSIHGTDKVTRELMEMYIERNMSLITASQLQTINEYRETRMDAQDITLPNLIDITEELLNILDDFFPDSIEEDKIFFAKEIKRVAERNTNITIQDETLDGDKILDLAEKDSRGTSYNKLITYLFAFRYQFNKNAYLKDDYKEFQELHRAYREKIELSEYKNKILDAHDEIRKMMHKPIYYSNSKIDSYDSINKTIDIMKSEYNKDINATDITGITTELDSFSSIAKKYGVTEDMVYHIKAMYRPLI